MYNSQRVRAAIAFIFELPTHVNLSGIKALEESAILHTIKTVDAMCNKIGKHANNWWPPNKTVQ